MAIKVLFAGARDEDGDPVDPCADEEFRKECAALRSIDSPHLLKFFGFGTTAEGNGFIVTELMVLGSLERVLHDQDRELTWRTRVSIGLQVALGMEHLHQRHMLHRDLKSANVVLDEQLKAKVCDFGLARVVRPARQVVMHSSFTGVTRRLPERVSSEGRRNGDGLSMQVRLTETAFNGKLDVSGMMTRATGTLLWMAPEVFRGDENYGPGVDVYSFGILLWELATRKTPWSELSSDPTELFRDLNHALQTGARPAIPEMVLTERGEFVAVMRRCWAGDPVDRPSFTEVARDLAACMS